MPPPVNVQTPLVLQTPLPFQIAQYARNGLVPHAVFESDVAASLNFAAAVRNKELFRWNGNITNIPTSGGSTRVRWRAAAHTSPLLRRLHAILLVARQSDGGSSGAQSNEVSVYVTSASGLTTYASGTINFGSSPVATADTTSEFGWGELILGGVPVNSDVYLRFEDGAHARLVSATVFEESLKLLSGNGYILPSPVAVKGPIYDQRRQDMYQLATNLWSKGAAHLFNWCVDLESAPQTNATATGKNIIDTSVTSVSASSPGWTIDLRYHNTVAQTTVPCAFKAYAKMSGSVNTGSIKLLDSGGATLATLSPNGSTAAWYSTTVNLPATEQKLDIQFSNPSASETLSVYACSLFQYA